MRTEEECTEKPGPGENVFNGCFVSEHLQHSSCVLGTVYFYSTLLFRVYRNFPFKFLEILSHSRKMYIFSFCTSFCSLPNMPNKCRVFVRFSPIFTQRVPWSLYDSPLLNPLSQSACSVTLFSAYYVFKMTIKTFLAVFNLSSTAILHSALLLAFRLVILIEHLTKIK